jgi:NAD(P)-dependent dehydrogenase (short-subunit alcohol dehydrogenase family)
MSDVSVVIVGGASRLGAGIGDALGVPFLPLEATSLEAESDDLVAARRLVWIHTVPASASAARAVALNGVFAEAATLLVSARAARTVADRSSASLVFIAVLPARGVMAGDHGAACDMATAAMDSLMRVEIGQWSNRGHRLLAVVYTGVAGTTLGGARPDDDIRQRTPMHELCTQRELADAIRFMGSQRAAYITGTSLHVDGGWNAYSWMYPARTI